MSVTDFGTSMTLPAEPRSVGQARRFLATALADAGLSHLADVAVLLVSELATNALLHARTPMEVALRSDGDAIRIEVSDANPALPRPRRYAPTATTGRGLALVVANAHRWGVEPHLAGKSVWFTLPTSPDPASRNDGASLPLGPAPFDFDAVESL